MEFLCVGCVLFTRFSRHALIGEVGNTWSCDIEQVPGSIYHGCQGLQQRLQFTASSHESSASVGSRPLASPYNGDSFHCERAKALEHQSLRFTQWYELALALFDVFVSRKQQ